MGNLLVISADPKSVQQITALAEPAGFRVRSVASADRAREWLPLQDFDIVLVDSRYGEGVPIELIQLGWKKNSLTIGGLFNFYGEVADQWPARVLGIRVFAGAAAPRSLAEFFKDFPENFGTVADYGILVVEDLDSPRDVICSYVEAMGYPNVVGAGTVAAALKILDQRPNEFFAIVTDLNMPQENGIDLIRQVRHAENLCHIPVIVLTAYATGENLLDCIAAGATGFVVKPPRKKTFHRELEKARRLFIARQSPRLCRPEDAQLLEQVLRAQAVI